MSIFTRFAARSLMKSRTRSLLTIIGIILSMTLFTAVLEGAYSTLHFIIRYSESTNGTVNGIFPDLSEQKEQELREDPAVKEVSVFRTLGFTLYAPNDTGKPYFCIGSIDEAFPAMAGMTLLSGRYPETGDELVVPLYMEYEQHGWKIGDLRTLEVGTTLESGRDLSLYMLNDHQTPKKIVDTEAHTFRIVGFYDIGLNYELVPNSSPCNLALTGGTADGTRTVLFTLKNPISFLSWIRTQNYSDSYFYNSQLLSCYGVTSDNGVNLTIRWFAIILVIIIVFGSVSLIYNAFSTSVMERTRQFGILKSVGASKGQIRRIVLAEAFLLSLIGIPFGLVLGCAGISAVFSMMAGRIEKILTGYSIPDGISLRLELNVWILGASVFICMITTLISAWIPAIRANRVQPIDAIRLSTDVKVRNREVKTSRLTEKLFGLPGTLAAKYFKRSRRRYRAVIVSLSLSILLFVFSFSFIRYLSISVLDLTAPLSKTDVLVTEKKVPESDPDQMLALLSEGNPVTKSIYYVTEDSVNVDRSSDHNLIFSGQAAALSLDHYGEYPNSSLGLNVHFSDGQYGRIRRLGSEEVISPIVLAFISDSEFRALLKKNHLQESAYFDSASPQGILYNSGLSRNYDPDQRVTILVPYEMIDSANLPVDAYMLLDYKMNDYTAVGTEGEGNEQVKLYYPTKDLQGVIMIRMEDLDPSKLIRIPEEETSFRVDLKIAGVISENLFCFPDNTPCLYYPYSMLDQLIPESARNSTGSFTRIGYAFQSRDHIQSYEVMRETVLDQDRDFTVYDAVEPYEQEKSLLYIIEVFIYAFISLISLIAIANVFNTMHTNITLRRREIAMLKSVGLSEKGYAKMMIYECLIYASGSLLIALPLGVALTYFIWMTMRNSILRPFFVPWEGVVIPLAVVFLVVFAAMLYSIRKTRKDNVIDALKTEII